MTPVPSSSVHLISSFAEHQIPLMETRKESAFVSELVRRQVATKDASSEAGRKNLEDELVLSMEEIRKHKSEKDAWVVVDGIVYDITRFVDTHPGGVEVIHQHLHLSDVGNLMRGEEGDSPDSHPHSKYAFRMLQQFRIGRVGNCRSGDEYAQSNGGSEESKYVVDLNKPLVFQVGKLGADYDRWVHDPIVQKEPPRFFESDVAEFFTRTAWWVIPAVWGPLVIYLAVLAFKAGLWLSTAPFVMAIGAFIWTFIEYLLHRYVFHMKTTGKWTNTAHYFLHGFHHKHPMDGTRLVFPPAVTGIIVISIWYLTEPLVLLVGRPVKLSMFSGGLLMYIIYDLTHYFLHFGTPQNELSRSLKRSHLNHHFRNEHYSFGVTTHFWDTVFDTAPQYMKNMLPDIQ